MIGLNPERRRRHRAYRNERAEGEAPILENINVENHPEVIEAVSEKLPTVETPKTKEEQIVVDSRGWRGGYSKEEIAAQAEKAKVAKDTQDVIEGLNKDIGWAQAVAPRVNRQEVVQGLEKSMEDIQEGDQVHSFSKIKELQEEGLVGNSNSMYLAEQGEQVPLDSVTKQEEVEGDNSDAVPISNEQIRRGIKGMNHPSGQSYENLDYLRNRGKKEESQDEDSDIEAEKEARENEGASLEMSEREKSRMEGQQNRRALRKAEREAQAAYDKALFEEKKTKNSNGLKRMANTLMGGEKESKNLRELRESLEDISKKREMAVADALLKHTEQYQQSKETGPKEKINTIVTNRAIDKIRKRSEAKKEAIESLKNPKVEKLVDLFWRNRSNAYKIAASATIGTGVVASASALFGAFALGATGVYGLKRVGTGTFSLLAGGKIIKGQGEKAALQGAALEEKLFKDLQAVKNPFENREALEEAMKNFEKLDKNKQKWAWKMLGTGLLTGGVSGIAVGGGLNNVFSALDNLQENANSVLEGRGIQGPENQKPSPAYAVKGPIPSTDSLNPDQFDSRIPSEQPVVPPIDGALDGSPAWQEQQVLQESSVASAEQPTLEFRSVEKGEGGLSYMKYIRETVRAELGIDVDSPIPEDAPEVYKQILDGSLHESAQRFGFFDDV